MEAALDEYFEGVREVSDAETQLAVPWALFHYPMQDQDASAAQVARDTRAADVTRALRDVLAAQLEAYLSVWEVREVEPGVGMTLHDMLTKEDRFVYEIAASRSLRSRDTILARVVDSGGVSFIAGLFPRALGPREADLVIREAQRLCRVRTRPVDPEHLRDPAVQLAIIGLWRTIATAPAVPPTLTNTDGDPFLLTTDHFDVAPGAEREIPLRMASFPGAEEPEEAAGEVSVVITRPGNAAMKDWDNTIIGRLAVRDRRMRIETNSTRRADALRAAIASHLGGLATYRLREEASVGQLLSQPGASQAPRGKRRPKASKPAEVAAAERELRTEYMTAWLDQEIPALGGLTPRAAAKRSGSRRALELLLREFEHHESSLPADEQLDVERLRKELGLDA